MEYVYDMDQCALAAVVAVVAVAAAAHIREIGKKMREHWCEVCDGHIRGMCKSARIEKLNVSIR